MTRRKRLSPPTRTPEPRQDASAVARSFGARDWLFVVALVMAVLLAYWPAWNGRMLFDDNAHITRADLQSWHGLWRIWTEVGVTQQYYPLSETAFWVQHKLWGDAMLGYHLVNIALHIQAALMAALILRRLEIPGAYFAAAIFALHPVHVESVAWITEQKNTLSAVFYFGAAMAYLRFDRSARYGLLSGRAGIVCVGAGEQDCDGDAARRLAGDLLVAAGTAVVATRRGCRLCRFLSSLWRPACSSRWWSGRWWARQGDAFDLGPIDRCLLAGRVIWFYLGKLFWPTHLLFIYPRWGINREEPWQYIFPLAALALLGFAWALRRRWRGPAAGLLFFAGTLFPVLGFLNVYWFVFSYVADHFQYLASLGIIVLVAAGVAMLLARRQLWGRSAGYAPCLSLLLILAGLTWQQSGIYADGEKLYLATLAGNPECWMAEHNLALVLADSHRYGAAIAHYRKALAIRPNEALICNNLGAALVKCGRFDDATELFRRAVELKPDLATPRFTLGVALGDQGRFPEAIASLEKALELKPGYAKAHDGLGTVLLRQGHLAEAIAEYRKAIELEPDDADCHYNLGLALARHRQMDEAIVEFGKAVALSPQFAEAHNNLGNAYSVMSRADEAVAEYRKAIQAKPDYAEAYDNLGDVYLRQGRIEEAVAAWRAAAGLPSARVPTLVKLAWTLATCPEPAVRNGIEAVKLAQRAVRLTHSKDVISLSALAAACAEAGRFSEATAIARNAWALAIQQNAQPLAESLKAQIAMYEAHTPFRDTPQPLPSPPMRP